MSNWVGYHLQCFKLLVRHQEGCPAHKDACSGLRKGRIDLTLVATGLIVSTESG